jgi:D-hydroxyproline dehydrogenase subunit beta
MKKVDVAIVGAGVLGLAHAYFAARARKSVAVFERSPRASGASIRNFGMIWPIGQPPGALHQLALRSRQHWVEILEAAHLPYEPSGSFHLVYENDEKEVAQEFAAIAPGCGYRCEWLEPASVLERSRAVQPENLRGGLWSPTELTVDPRLVIREIPAYLHEQFGVEFHYQTAVQHVEPPCVEAGGEKWHAEQVLVCTGDDFETLFLEHFRTSGITRCKLQMLRTNPQPDRWALGPSLAAGLTLRFYPAFKICKSLEAYRERVAREMPAYERWAIHCLVSQAADGSITLGDSHEYGLAVDIFDKPSIDELILRYTQRFLKLPDWTLAERWHGVYAKHPEKPYVSFSPTPNVQVVTAPGGSGMTLSFGLAEQTVRELGWLA